MHRASRRLRNFTLVDLQLHNSSSEALDPDPAVEVGNLEAAASSRSNQHQFSPSDLPQTLDSNASSQGLTCRGGSTLYHPLRHAQTSGRTSTEHVPDMTLLSSLHEALAPAEQALHQVAVTQRR